MSEFIPPRRDRGSAMVVALMMIFVMMGLLLGYSEAVLVDSDATDNTIDGIQSDAIAQAGLSLAMAELRTNVDLDKNGVVGTIGSNSGVGPGQTHTPRKIANGYCYVYFANTPTKSKLTNADYLFDYTLISVASTSTDFTPTSRGYKGGAIRKMIGYCSAPQGGPLWFAIFAGNKSASTTYTLKLEGATTKGDNVVGGVYSGKKLTMIENGRIRTAVPGDPNYNAAYNTVAEAKVNGALTDYSGIVGTSLPTGTSPSFGSEKIPDLAKPDFLGKADAAFNNVSYIPPGGTSLDAISPAELRKQFVNVKRELEVNGASGKFNASATTYTNLTTYTDTGHGDALQIRDRGNPAHIFRRNPSDRNISTMNQATFGDDYYLEDPTSLNDTSGSDAERVTGTDADVGFTPANPNAYAVNLTRNTADPVKEGNKKIYVVDGNVWVSDLNAYSFFIKNQDPANPTQADPNGTQITIVVRGNVYFGDNIFYQNAQKDGVVFIAMQDSRTPAQGGPTDPKSTGNVYIGDPQFGTIRRLESYLYADNDFVDNNLTGSGSSQFTILGTMSAGDEVRIQRGSGSAHSRMDVFFDSRIRNNSAFKDSMPGISALLPSGNTFVFNAVIQSAYNPLPPNND